MTHQNRREETWWSLFSGLFYCSGPGRTFETVGCGEAAIGRAAIPHQDAVDVGAEDRDGVVKAAPRANRLHCGGRGRRDVTPIRSHDLWRTLKYSFALSPTATGRHRRIRKRSRSPLGERTPELPNRTSRQTLWSAHPDRGHAHHASGFQATKAQGAVVCQRATTAVESKPTWQPF